MLLVGLSTLAGPARAQDREAALLATRALDSRLAAIGHRLATANLSRCRDRQWLGGFTVHDLSQYGGEYRQAARRAFQLEAGTGILAVVEGGPASRAGLRADDILLGMDGRPLPRATSGAFEEMEIILDYIDRAFDDGSAILDIRRGGERLTLAVQAEMGCASRFQLLPSSRMNALADGRYVQLTTAIAAFATDDQELAAIAAHEFAHNVLRHRAQLDLAGVARGLLGNFGRNARLIRTTEIEADRMSIYLLDRAGYDVEAPIRFWSRFGRRGLNFLGSPTHPNWRRRIALFEEEITAVRRARAAGSEPVPPNFQRPAP